MPAIKMFELDYQGLTELDEFQVKNEILAFRQVSVKKPSTIPVSEGEQRYAPRPYSGGTPHLAVLYVPKENAQTLLIKKEPDNNVNTEQSPKTAIPKEPKSKPDAK